jgi:hypothetical protein
MNTFKWQFPSRFRRNAFGWRSDAPIRRIKEALAEIKLVSRSQPTLAAEGAIILIEKLSPALAHVDSSSGALGNAVNRAIDTLVAIIAKANVEDDVRQAWLNRLWQALQDDDMPYIESLGQHWGTLCVTPGLANLWSEYLQAPVEQAWHPNAKGHGYFKGTMPWLASTYAAGRHEHLLTTLNKSPITLWHYRQWGVKALLALGRKAEAVRYAEGARGRNESSWQIAQACEAILLSSGLAEEAYQRYAIEANPGATYLATFRAIAKKYPHKAPESILSDLVATTPGSEGKWFAAAKDAGLFDAALALVAQSPADPRTLTRAARDFVEEKPAFALAAGMASLHWISRGHGFDLNSEDVLEAYDAVMQAAKSAKTDVGQIKAKIQPMLSSTTLGNPLMKSALARHLND